MTRIVFCVTFIVLQTFTSGFKNPWFDDIGTPNFLWGAEQRRVEEEKELDSTNDSPSDLIGVLRDNYVTDAATQHESIISSVASHSNGTNTTMFPGNQAPVSANSLTYHCKYPHPTVVELHRDPGVQLLPPAIRLHRCVGACTLTQDHQNCTVTAQEEIVISVTEIIAGGTQLRNITVYNHTACACDCITRQSDCNQTIQDFDSDTCGCTCKQDGSQCSAAIQSWDSNKCECECVNSLICDDSANQEWNSEICDCDCKQKVKDRCPRKNKVLNESTCTCECATPLPVCSGGTSFHNYNCTCW